MSKSRFDKHCVLCGSYYQFCSNCDRFSSLPRWMESFDNDNCHTIFNTIMEYKAGVKTLDQAEAILSKCDYSYRDKIKQTNENMDGYITAILANGSNKVEVVSETLDVSEEVPVEPATTVQSVEDEEVVKLDNTQEEHKEKKNYNKRNYHK